MNKRFLLHEKVIFLTGSCGSIGQGLLNLLKDKEYKKIVCIDNNEEGIFHQKSLYSNFDNLEFFCVDLNDIETVRALLRDVDIVIHAAAYKHVSLGESLPHSTIHNNVVLLQKFLNTCGDLKVEKFIFTSSDKAVNPTTVMGITKLLGEKLVLSSNDLFPETAFSVTRFGNVIGSSGSVLPIFRKQVNEGLPLTVTDIEMTRYIMTISDAVNFVMRTVELAKGGEIFLTKMKAIKIIDLAKAPQLIFKSSYGKEIVIVGKREGEKLYEELMTIEERGRSHFVGADIEIHASESIAKSKSVEGTALSCNFEVNSSLEVHESVDDIILYLKSNQLV